MISSILLYLNSVAYATLKPVMNVSALNNSDLTSPDGSVIQANISSIEVLPLLIDVIKSQTHISLEDAIASAKENVGPNSTAVDASLTQDGGFLAYKIGVIDSQDNLNTIVIDPSNGNITLVEKNPKWMVSSLIMGFP